MEELQTLLENYMKSSYRTTPIRSPFSNQQYYSSGQATHSRWLDLTDLYNATYRTFYREDGFKKVKYNEPLNILVMWPEDGAEAYEQVDYSPVAAFGLKAARGFGKDYRFLDKSIPGAGKVAIDPSTAEEMMTEPYEQIQEIRPAYTRNLGQNPIEKLDEGKQVDGYLLQEYHEEDPIHLARAYYFGDIELEEIDGEEKREKVQQIASDLTEDGLTTHELEPSIGGYLQKVIRDELSSMEHREELTELNAREVEQIKQEVRRYQLNEEPSRVVDMLLENAVNAIEERDALFVGENELEALQKVFKSNEIYD